MPSYSAYTLNLVAETTVYQNEVKIGRAHV